MSYFIIIRGPLGSGKSTIAKKLAESIKAKYISIDQLLEENDLTQDKEEGYISQKSFLKDNEIVISQAKKVLEQGRPVIFDGNFYWHEVIEDLINKLDYHHYIFTLKVSLRVCLERDKNRSQSYGVDTVKAVYEKTTEFDYGIIIDAAQSLNQSVEEILANLPK